MPGSVFAQDLTNLAIDGLVKEDGGSRLTGVRVVLYQDGREVDSQISERNGRFEFFLDFGHEFTIRVSKSGFVDKIIYVNTKRVPQDEQAWGYEWPITVELFKKIQGVDYSLLDQPIGKIYYEERVENFVSDNAYARQIEKEVEKLEDAQKAAIKAEEDRLERLEEDFELAIKDAENAMKDGDFLTAKDNLLAAQSIKPNSEITDQLLTEVEAKLNQEGASQEKYLSLLASADQAFGNTSFDEAITLYTQASEIKPEESYPKNRIEESRKQLALARAAKEAEDKIAAEKRKFEDLVAKGDEAMKAESYRDAKTYYQNALAIRDESYPRTQITKAEEGVERLVEAEAEASKKARQNALYTEKIDKADVAFNSGNYENALVFYKEAQAIKPNEAYPTEQLSAIEAKRSELAEKRREQQDKQARNEQYTKLIASADRALQLGEYEKAKTDFEAASELKPDEQYPKEQLTKISAELEKLALLDQEKAEKAEKQQAYEDAIAKADKAFENQQYNQAKTAYTEASAILADKTYPSSQIKRIEDILTKQSEEQKLETAYNESIAQAESLYNEEKLEEALTAYRQAQKIRPNDPLPGKQITKITTEIEAKKRLAQQASKEQAKENQFNSLVVEADKAFKADNYSFALQKYEEASLIKKDEYVGEQIDAIRTQLQKQEASDQRLAEEKERRRNYATTIEKARIEMQSRDYDKARETFNLAGTYAKDESDHTEGLAEIDSILAKQAEEEQLAQQAEQERKEKEAKRDKYNALIRTGNDGMNNRSFEQARVAFEDALKIFPNESLPKDKLAAIDALEKEAEKDRARAEFNRLVSAADKSFQEKNYESALADYEEALTYNEGSSYVQDRIQRTKKTIADLNKVEEVEGKDSHRRVIEETYDEGRTKVTIRRVIENDKEKVYKRVVHSWGGRYYFLDDQPITELVWNRETAK